jgi:hypothetical protein
MSCIPIHYLNGGKSTTATTVTTPFFIFGIRENILSYFFLENAVVGVIAITIFL